MKKRLNIIFFSLCFIVSIMLEAYFLQVENTDLLSIAGIGVVVLITGYLLLDSIRSRLEQGAKDVKFYIDQIIREEMERSSERYIELSNLQKGSYTATKKNTVMISGQLADTLQRLEKLEDTTSKALHKIADLQKKSLEGQKNALNYEINYSKANTRQLIKVLREEKDRTEVGELMTRLLESMNRNNELLEAQLNKLNSMSLENVYLRETDSEKPLSQAFEAEFMDGLENNQRSSLPDTTNEEFQVDSEWPEEKIDVLPEIEWETEARAEETAVLSDELSMMDAEETAYSQDDVSQKSEDSILGAEEALEEDWMSGVNNELSNIMSDWSIGTENQEDKQEVTDINEENASSMLSSMEEELTVEASDQVIESAGEEIQEDSSLTEASVPEITPLYSDPNKALSADEIAALFASFGQ